MWILVVVFMCSPAVQRESAVFASILVLKFPHSSSVNVVFALMEGVLLEYHMISIFK